MATVECNHGILSHAYFSTVSLVHCLSYNKYSFHKKLGLRLATNYTYEARRERSACVQSTPLDITYILLNRLTVSHATENSWSKMAVHVSGNLSYFHYKIIRVFAEISAHGEISAQRELYPNSFKCTSIFSLFLCLQKDIQQRVWQSNCFSGVVNIWTS